MEYSYFFASYEDFKITTVTKHEPIELDFARHAKRKLAPFGIKCYVDRDDAELGKSHFNNYDTASKISKYLVLLLTEVSLKWFEANAINLSNFMFQADLFRRLKDKHLNVFAVRLGDFGSENDQSSIASLRDMLFTSPWDDCSNKEKWDRFIQMGRIAEPIQGLEGPAESGDYTSHHHPIQEERGEFVENSQVPAAASGDFTSHQHPIQEVSTRRTECVNDDVPHVMFSYSWAHQKTMLKIWDHLRRAGYKVWMDVDNMTGNMNDAMANAVEKSAVVLYCLSREFLRSENCKKEAEYAALLRKDMIPLLLESGFKANSWLGLITGYKLYVDFSCEDEFQESMVKLIKELGDRGKRRSGFLSGSGPDPVAYGGDCPSEGGESSVPSLQE